MSAINAYYSNFISAIRSAPSVCAERIRQVPVIAAKNLQRTFTSVETFCDRHIHHFEGLPTLSTAKKIKVFAIRIFLATPLKMIGSVARSIAISSEFYVLRKDLQKIDDPSLQQKIIAKIQQFTPSLGAYNESQKPTLIYKTRELIEHLEIYLARLNKFSFDYDTELLSLKILLKDLQQPGMKTESYVWYHQMMVVFDGSYQLHLKLSAQLTKVGATPLMGTGDVLHDAFHLHRINERLSTVILKKDLAAFRVCDQLMKHPLFKKLSKAKQEQYQGFREFLSNSLQGQVLNTSVSNQLNLALKSFYTQNYSKVPNYDPNFQDLL